MGFTRSTTTTNVHQSMPDYPSAEGYTAAQLKTAFDAPATGLKEDINDLEEELEATTAAANLGADKITSSDASADNVQAKLEKIYQDLQEVVIGEIPDNSITQAKIDGEYEATLAKKDGTLQNNLNAAMLGGQASTNYALKNNALQTGLNAEMLGGSTLAQLITRLSSYFQTGTCVMSTNESSVYGTTINLGFIPSLIILAKFPTSASGDYDSDLGIIFSNKLIYYVDNKYHSLDVTVSNTGVVTIPKGMSRGTYNYIAFKSSL